MHHLRFIGAAFCCCSSGEPNNNNNALRPVIPPDSFAHQSSFRDGFEIRPAPGKVKKIIFSMGYGVVLYGPDIVYYVFSYSHFFLFSNP